MQLFEGDAVREGHQPREGELWVAHLPRGDDGWVPRVIGRVTKGSVERELRTRASWEASIRSVDVRKARGRRACTVGEPSILGVFFGDHRLSSEPLAAEEAGLEEGLATFV